MMNHPLRRVHPLARPATPALDRATHAPPPKPIGGSVWPIRGGSMRAIVDRRTDARSENTGSRPQNLKSAESTRSSIASRGLSVRQALVQRDWPNSFAVYLVAHSR